MFICVDSYDILGCNIMVCTARRTMMCADSIRSEFDPANLRSTIDSIRCLLWPEYPRCS